MKWADAKQDSYPFYGLSGLVKRVWFDEFETMRIRSAPLSCASLLEEKKLWTFLVESISEVAPCPLTPSQDVFPAWAFSLSL